MASVTPSSDYANLQSQYSKAFRDLEESKDSQIKREQKQHQQDVDRIETAYQANLNKKEEEANKLTEKLRNDSANAIANEQSKGRESLEKLQRESYNSRGKIASAIPLTEHQKAVSELAQQSERRHKDDIINSQMREKDLTDLAHQIREKAADELLKSQERHVAELTDLNENTRKKSLYDNQENTKKIEGMNEQLRTAQKDHQEETKRITNTYNRYVEDLKKGVDQKEESSQDKNRSTLKNKDDFLTKTLSAHNQEYHQSLKDLEKIYFDRIDQIAEEKNQKDLAASKRLQTTLENDHEIMQNAMTKQAESYRKNIEQAREEGHENLKALQEGVKLGSKRQHIEDISPAAENRVRHGVIDQYQKSLNAEVDRNKLTQEKLAETYGNNYREFLEKTQDKETSIIKQSEADRAHDRAQFVDTIMSTQQEALSRSRDKDASYQLQVDKLQRKFAYALERQKREYENLIDGMKNESESKILTIQEEAQKTSKIAIKTLSEKQTEILREYDKKLSDQREQYEYLIEDIKTSLKSETHDVERRAKSEIETQTKTYEQKIAQIEAQNKEHEKYLALGYQEQLDKLRKSYETNNQQKKS